jgi:hypothetical protein
VDFGTDFGVELEVEKGLSPDRFHVWALLAADHLEVMAALVSNKQVFSSAGITISKPPSHLKGGIVEALQCLKYML